MAKALISGGAGFVASHLVEHLLKNTDWDIVIFDKLNYASNGFNRLRDIQAYDDRRVRTFVVDLAAGPISEGVKAEVGPVDYVVHCAAESSVDKSIVEPEVFVKSNILGTFYLLEYVKELDVKRYIQFSTDEVFGPAPEGVYYKEWDRHNPTNPYSASKSSADDLCLAWANTYGLPIIISHTMNVFGQRQHPEKFIPGTVRNVLMGDKVIIHADPSRTKSGSRFYIHARNVASAVLFLLTNSNVSRRDKFNIVGEKEVSNLDLALLIADIVGQPLDYEMVDFHSSRPGHDLRYALDGTKMQQLGWVVPATFEDSLRKTINWMLAPENERWLHLKSVTA